MPHFGLAVALTLFVIVNTGFVLWASRKVETEEDYVVAGRKLPLSLSTFTLLATWFGAGTVLTASDEVYSSGLAATALEPYGAGICLLLAGIFFAKPLWKMNLLTLGDLFARRFGKKAEVLSSLLVVPGFLGWVAVQIVALSGILDLFFDMPLWFSILLIGVLSMIFTLLGGDVVCDSHRYLADGLYFCGRHCSFRQCIYCCGVWEFYRRSAVPSESDPF